MPVRKVRRIWLQLQQDNSYPSTCTAKLLTNGQQQHKSWSAISYGTNKGDDLSPLLRLTCPSEEEQITSLIVNIVSKHAGHHCTCAYNQL